LKKKEVAAGSVCIHHPRESWTNQRVRKSGYEGSAHSFARSSKAHFTLLQVFLLVKGILARLKYFYFHQKEFLADKWMNEGRGFRCGRQAMGRF
jgi:hypothetical protein